MGVESWFIDIGELDRVAKIIVEIGDGPVWTDDSGAETSGVGSTFSARLVRVGIHEGAHNEKRQTYDQVVECEKGLLSSVKDDARGEGNDASQ